MNTYLTKPMTRVATITLSALLAFGFVAAPAAEAASLTQSQIQAVTSLLVAFGVDTSTIANVQAALSGTSATTAATSTSSSLVTANMIGLLRLGASGDKVKYLQVLLAADPDVYPEGLITGYYGGLTERAVQRFQKKHGVEQVGFIGPKTLQHLQGDLDDLPIAVASSTSSGVGVCAIVPPGHLIAPGWLKHHEDDEDDIPVCGTIPPGIAWKLGITATSTSDHAKPVISSLQASSVTNTGATITWTTNEPATGVVWVGATTAYGTTFTQGAVRTTTHAVTITGLSASTVYHFVVHSTDASGNTAFSSDMTFTTAAAADVTAPVISAVATGGITATGATITWTTNENASGIVKYGTTTAYGATASQGSTLSTSHSLALSGLTAATQYHFVVTSSDAAGNAATSSDMTFTTSAAPDTTAPVLSAISIGSLASTSAQVSWTTNESATSKVYYGTTTPLTLSTAMSVASSALSTSHALVLPSLATSTTYYYVVESADAAGNTATSTSASFTTLGN